VLQNVGITLKPAIVKGPIVRPHEADSLPFFGVILGQLSDNIVLQQLVCFEFPHLRGSLKPWDSFSKATQSLSTVKQPSFSRSRDTNSARYGQDRWFFGDFVTCQLIDLTGGAYCPERNRRYFELVKPDLIKPPNPYLGGALKVST
jgi:hypothetical protein